MGKIKNVLKLNSFNNNAIDNNTSILTMISPYQKEGVMKKIIALLSGTLLLAGCFDSSSTSASDTNNPNDISSSSISTGEYLGDGYTFATTYTYDEATGLLNMGTVTCNYKPDSKSFIWGENNNPLYKNKIKIIGDSMWIGPLERRVSEDSIGQAWYDRYHNIDTLALSNDNNGIVGSWTITTCTRVIGKNEINCTPEFHDYVVDERALKFTPDSVYITMRYKTLPVAYEKSFTSYALLQEMGFDFDPTMSELLKEHGFIKIYSDGYFYKSFSLNDQPFERNFVIRADSTGMFYSLEYSSNEKKCLSSMHGAFITKEVCSEGNKDILLYKYDDENDNIYRDGGPLNFYATGHIDDRDQCRSKLVNEETRDMLNQLPHHIYD